MGGHKEDSQPKSPVVPEDTAARSTEQTGAPKPPAAVAELDLAFVVDNTGSMGSWIRETQKNIQSIIKDIVKEEASDVRFALVAYRDHPPQDSSFVTRTYQFSPNLREMQGWVDGMSAAGGGDGPEAVADGLHDALHLGWRPNAAKIVVVVSDAPPHGIGCGGDGFPNGCPAGHDPIKIANEMAEKGITIYSVICGNFEGQAFYQGLCEITGGQYCPLASSKLLSQVIVAGAQEEISLERLMAEAAAKVKEEEQKAGRELGEDELAVRLQSSLSHHQARQVKFQGMELPAVEESAQMYTRCADLADLRAKAPASRSHLAAGSWGGGYSAPAAEMAAPAMSASFAPVSHAQCARMATKAKKRSGGFFG